MRTFRQFLAVLTFVGATAISQVSLTSVAAAAGPVFGNAKVAMLSPEATKKVTAKGSTANYYGGVGYTYAYYSYYYGYYASQGTTNTYWMYLAAYYAAQASQYYSYALYASTLGY